MTEYGYTPCQCGHSPADHVHGKCSGECPKDFVVTLCKCQKYVPEVTSVKLQGVTWNVAKIGPTLVEQLKLCAKNNESLKAGSLIDTGKLKPSTIKVAGTPLGIQGPWFTGIDISTKPDHIVHSLHGPQSVEFGDFDYAQLEGKWLDEAKQLSAQQIAAMYNLGEVAGKAGKGLKGVAQEIHASNQALWPHVQKLAKSVTGRMKARKMKLRVLFIGGPLAGTADVVEVYSRSEGATALTVPVPSNRDLPRYVPLPGEAPVWGDTIFETCTYKFTGNTTMHKGWMHYEVVGDAHTNKDFFQGYDLRGIGTVDWKRMLVERWDGKEQALQQFQMMNLSEQLFMDMWRVVGPNGIDALVADFRRGISLETLEKFHGPFSKKFKDVLIAARVQGTKPSMGWNIPRIKVLFSVEIHKVPKAICDATKVKWQAGQYEWLQDVRYSQQVSVHSTRTVFIQGTCRVGFRTANQLFRHMSIGGQPPGAEILSIRTSTSFKIMDLIEPKILSEVEAPEFPVNDPEDIMAQAIRMHLAMG